MSDAVKKVSGWDGVRKGMPAVGASAERSKDITLADIELFSALTGDRQPLHTDKAVAEASRFGGLIVQGGVTSGLLNAVVAEDLPGPGTVFLSVEWKFVKPVYVGDRITASVKTLEVREDKPLCTLETQVRNQKGEVCLEGTAVTYTAPLPL